MNKEELEVLKAVEEEFGIPLKDFDESLQKEKDTRERYQKSPKGKVTRDKYQQSEKGKIQRKKYQESPGYKEQQTNYHKKRYWARKEAERRLNEYRTILNESK